MIQQCRCTVLLSTRLPSGRTEATECKGPGSQQRSPALLSLRSRASDRATDTSVSVRDDMPATGLGSEPALAERSVSSSQLPLATGEIAYCRKAYT